MYLQFYRNIRISPREKEQSMPSTRSYRAGKRIERNQREHARHAWRAERINCEPRYTGALFVNEAAYVRAIARHRDLEREADRILAGGEVG
jgi:hypothetical protein